MRRGQLTIFFLLGLVILFAVALLFFARTEMTPEQTTTQTTPQAEQYLISCMNDALYDWLDKLATNDDVWLEARNPELTHHTNFSPSLNLTQDLYEDLSEAYDQNIQSSFFGINNLQALCDDQGPNNKSQTTNTHCSTYGLGSLQKDLTNNLSQALQTCQTQGVDVELGVDISDWSLVETEAIFSRGNIVFRADFDETTLEQNQQIRLMSLYNLLEERIRFTTRDPRITIDDTDHMVMSTFYSSAITTERAETPGYINFTFTDSNSQYRGSPLQISFLAEQRSNYTDIDGIEHNPN